METKEITELLELLAEAKVTIRRPNEHLPYTTVTLLYHSEDNADALVALLRDDDINPCYLVDERPEQSGDTEMSEFNMPMGASSNDEYFDVPSAGDDDCPECGCDGTHLADADRKLLTDIWKYFDDTGDGAPDSSSLAVRNLNFAAPLERLIRRLT